MSVESGAFMEIEGVDGVYVAHTGKLSSTAIRLKSGGLCLYSPVAAMAKKGAAFFDRLGDVTILFAPNHYHNKGLAPYAALFPDAKLVAPSNAEARLKKVTGLEFGGLDDLEKDLPDHIKLLKPDGLKTGEVWLQVKQDPEVVWIVTDAFSSERLPQGAYAEQPTLLGTFPKFGVQDAKTYREWVEREISECEPTIVLPCHGSPIRGADLGSALLKLLDETF
ncbi:MAG: hypothetical protein AAGE61_15600 [Pseudomonadota bacterium]